MRREARLRGKTVLVLREAKPVPSATKHKCAVYHGLYATRWDYRCVIQCECGRRYHCRKEWGTAVVSYIWARRLLPWPPRQKGWPGGV